MASGRHQLIWAITCDRDDPAMTDPEMHDWMVRRGCMVHYGNHKSKIEAVNAGMRAFTQWDILVLVSDDMIPVVRGWDDIVVSDMVNRFPDLDGALNYNDGKREDGLCTLSIMGRSLYKRFGYIYHPAYKSEYCDNEFTEVCNALGKMARIDRVIVKHEWYEATGKDDLFVRNRALNAVDKKTYARRKSRGFPKREYWFMAIPEVLPRILRRLRKL